MFGQRSIGTAAGRHNGLASVCAIVGDPAEVPGQLAEPCFNPDEQHSDCDVRASQTQRGDCQRCRHYVRVRGANGRSICVQLAFVRSRPAHGECV